MNDKKVYSLCEAVADLAAMFEQPARAPVVPGNYRDKVSLAIEWAEAFEHKHARTVWGETESAGEYLDAIQAWFDFKYTAWRKSATDTHPNT